MHNDIEMALPNRLALWALLLESLLQPARSQVGVSICACQPSVYTFQFNFSAFCDVGTVDFREGVEGADCFVRGVGLGSENTVDTAPVQISTVSIMELDKRLRVLAQTPYVGDFRDGDEITYTSVAATQEGAAGLSPDLMLGGLQLDMVGINQLEQPITNVWIILFENDCGIFPVLEVGDQVGWTIIEDLRTPRSEVCPIAATESPTESPTLASAQGPLTTASPTYSLAFDKTKTPTIQPSAYNSTMPICVQQGKAGKRGKSGKAGSGKSGVHFGKSGDGKSGGGDRYLEEDGYGKGSGKGYYNATGYGKGFGKGSGKGYGELDECLPAKKEKPSESDSHKKIQKSKGKSGKGGKAGAKGGKAAGKSGEEGKAGKAAKKHPMDSQEKMHKLGGSGKSGKAKDETKAITFGKGQMESSGKGQRGKGEGGSAPLTSSSVLAPTRIPKKSPKPLTTREAKLVKPPETRAGSFKVEQILEIKPPSIAPTPVLATDHPVSATLLPTSNFERMNAEFFHSSLSHWLQHEGRHTDETDGRMLRPQG